MRDPRPEIPDWGQGVLALIVMLPALTVVVGFYWWTIPVACGFGIAAWFGARQSGRRPKP